MIYNYKKKCESNDISITDCFYFRFDVSQCMHVLIVNSILFGNSLYEIVIRRVKINIGKSVIKQVIFVKNGIYFRHLCWNNCCLELFFIDQLVVELGGLKSCIYQLYFQYVIINKYRSYS
jgi:hypothetical protein